MTESTAGASWWLAALMLLAAPLQGQATPSISPSGDDLRGVVSLREYIDVRLTSLREVVEAQATAQKEAIIKAETSLNDRLEGVPQTFVMKQEFASRADAVDERLGRIENRLSSFDGSLKIGWMLFLVLQIGLAAWFRRAVSRNGNGRTA